nr:M48 family metalloprotease [Flavobacteriales bacterium]
NLETDADARGIERLRAAGVDPQGMVKLLELLGSEAGDMPEELSFLSSHPLTEERIAKAKEAVGDGTLTDPVTGELAELFERLKAE